ncbi:T9SS type A sorting domain-containing protein [Cryomorpha ignava]|uniref:T9SS type A sorting domain-containing protein n=1 Tax=Cryomorpha ignava TaxID=101383 RepID=A0A7K3WLL5_9FLAO|nr:T9SS type A sorting domain-containing protein [Cryomorpha ignava]NEN22546.1 T9SS type A sorting domain-containing protein [Cryomorpha ignava]
MKKLLLLTISLATAALSYSQCTPNTDFGDEPFGVAPDTVVNFVSGSVNNIYSQQIDVKVPTDGTFANAPFITVDSAMVMAISGLPPGLSLDCAGNTVSECTYLAGTEGCAVISGIPTAAGTYELTVELLVYTNFNAIPYPVPGYRIVVDGTIGLEENDNLAFKMEDIRPNPANLSASLFLESKRSGKAEFRVFDLVGKEVHSKELVVVQGRNKINYNTSQLPEGVYIYRLDAFGESMTSRLVIVH